MRSKTWLKAGAAILLLRGALELPARAEENVRQVVGGRMYQGSMLLDAPAAEELRFTLTSSDEDAAVPVPRTLVVPKGARTAVFDIKTLSVGDLRPVTIQASLESGDASGSILWGAVSAVSAVFSPAAPVAADDLVASFSIRPHAVFGGQTVRGALRLKTSVKSDVPIKVTSESDLASVSPATVVVPEGETEVGFDIATREVREAQTFYLTALQRPFTAAANSHRTSLTLNPVLVSKLAPSRTQIAAGGEVAMGTLALEAPAPGKMEIPLVSEDPASVVVPAAVAFEKGETEQTFDIKSGLEAKLGPVRIGVLQQGKPRYESTMLVVSPAEMLRLREAESQQKALQARKESRQNALRALLEAQKPGGPGASLAAVDFSALTESDARSLVGEFLSVKCVHYTGGAECRGGRFPTVLTPTVAGKPLEATRTLAIEPEDLGSREALGRKIGAALLPTGPGSRAFGLTFLGKPVSLGPWSESYSFCFLRVRGGPAPQVAMKKSIANFVSSDESALAVDFNDAPDSYSYPPFPCPPGGNEPLVKALCCSSDRKEDRCPLGANHDVVQSLCCRVDESGQFARDFFCPLPTAEFKKIVVSLLGRRGVFDADLHLSYGGESDFPHRLWIGRIDTPYQNDYVDPRAQRARFCYREYPGDAPKCQGPFAFRNDSRALHVVLDTTRDKYEEGPRGYQEEDTPPPPKKILVKNEVTMPQGGTRGVHTLTLHFKYAGESGFAHQMKVGDLNRASYFSDEDIDPRVEDVMVSYRYYAGDAPREYGPFRFQGDSMRLVIVNVLPRDRHDDPRPKTIQEK